MSKRAVLLKIRKYYLKICQYKMEPEVEIKEQYFCWFTYSKKIGYNDPTNTDRRI